MMLYAPAPSLSLKNPFVRSIASEHKLSTPARAAAINRRSIKGSKLTVLRAIEGQAPHRQAPCFASSPISLLPASAAPRSRAR
jgi:hypothetical protein